MSTAPDPFTIVIVPPPAGAPRILRANAELHFTTGPLTGLKLCGFGIWQSKDRRPPGSLSVSVPTLRFERSGEPWRYKLLRPINALDDHALVSLRGRILDAYRAWKLAA